MGCMVTMVEAVSAYSHKIAGQVAYPTCTTHALTICSRSSLNMANQMARGIEGRELNTLRL